MLFTTAQVAQKTIGIAPSNPTLFTTAQVAQKQGLSQITSSVLV